MGRVTHGQTNHPIFVVWKGMMYRCNNPKSNRYDDYGGRGIKVCERWHDVRNFIADMYPSYIEGLQLNRKENDGNYEPDNCKWSTPSQNSKNKRNSSNMQCDLDHVSFIKRDRRWRVSFTFASLSDAEKAVQAVLGTN